ncbi:hypothetical protein [Salinivibrio sp. IB282]|uniref:hypothetical protein n=1 Tax=Salinivibrio sp. IB282 TaxID=1766122 RepID=UPI001056AD74|nr:hypothetical protein [Salinivibrio sp. IB282]
MCYTYLRFLLSLKTPAISTSSQSVKIPITTTPPIAATRLITPVEAAAPEAPIKLTIVTGTLAPPVKGMKGIAATIAAIAYGPAFLINATDFKFFSSE